MQNRFAPSFSNKAFYYLPPPLYLINKFIYDNLFAYSPLYTSEMSQHHLGIFLNFHDLILNDELLNKDPHEGRLTL